jgi:hypothetical protein
MTKLVKDIVKRKIYRSIFLMNMSIKIINKIFENQNAMSFLSLMFYLQQSWKRGQNRFCLEANRVGERRSGMQGRGGPNNVFTYE